MHEEGLEKEIRQLKEKITELEEENKKLKEESKSNNTIVNDNSININIYAYNRPFYPPPITNPRKLSRIPSVNKFLLNHIWFNKDFPQNHTILPISNKRRETIVYDGNQWTRRSMEDVLSDLNLLLNNVVDNYMLGELVEKVENRDNDIPEFVKQKIEEHLRNEDELEMRDIKEKLLFDIVQRKLRELGFKY
jgi:hypothetical protein